MWENGNSEHHRAAEKTQAKDPRRRLKIVFFPPLGRALCESILDGQFSILKYLLMSIVYHAYARCKSYEKRDYLIFKKLSNT